MRRLILLTDVAAFAVVLGIPDGALGVLWPGMRVTFRRPIGDLGYVAIAGTVLYLLGGVVYSQLSHRISNRRLIFGACATSSGAAACWAASNSWPAVLVAFGVLGFGRGAVDAAANADAAGDIKKLGWLHAGWSIGGTVGPLLVTSLAAAATWRTPVVVVAVAAAFVTTATAACLREPTRPRQPRFSSGSPPTTLPRAKAAMILATFGCYTAAEAGPIAWGYIYLTSHRHSTAAAATMAVATFWLALTIARIGIGVRGQTAHALPMLVTCGAVFSGSLTLLWLGPSWSAFVAMPLAGASSGPIFPLLVNITPIAVGSSGASRTIGLAVAAAAAGGPAAVFVEGRVANAHGVGEIAPIMLLASLAVVAALLGLAATLGRYAQVRRSVPES